MLLGRSATNKEQRERKCGDGKAVKLSFLRSGVFSSVFLCLVDLWL